MNSNLELRNSSLLYIFKDPQIMSISLIPKTWDFLSDDAIIKKRPKR